MAPSVAALAVLRKSRRFQFMSVISRLIVSADQLELGKHGEGPEQVLDAGGLRVYADESEGLTSFGGVGRAAERSQVRGLNERLPVAGVFGDPALGALLEDRVEGCAVAQFDRLERGG